MPVPTGALVLLIRLGLIILTIMLANVVTTTPGGAVADRLAGEASALSTGTPARPIVGTPYRVLPPGGGRLVDTSPGSSLGPIRGVSTIDQLGVTVEGAMAGEVVAGQSYSSPRPNERVELPGLGYVVLNEQFVSNGGQATTSITVRAIRLVVTGPNVQGVAPGTEIVAAQASSGVPAIDAVETVAARPAASETPIPAIPLSTRAPIDATIDQSGGVVSLDFDNDNAGNDNSGNDNDAGTTPTAGAQRPVVVTVIVVVVTPSATPTTPVATPTPTPRR